jgi:ABC-type lipoprotein release transport system permease subunit
MKCLGALDRFIVRLFLLESSGLGVIGTVIGIVVGFLLTMFRVTITYGFYPWKYFPVTLVFQSAVISLIVGTVLSVLAAIYPAWTAAKMEPVAAMRIDA